MLNLILFIIKNPYFPSNSCFIEKLPKLYPTDIQSVQFLQDKATSLTSKNAIIFLEKMTRKTEMNQSFVTYIRF